MCDLHLTLYMFLHVYAAYPDNGLPNPGYLQDAAGNQDTHGGGGGHQIGYARLIGCISY
jgi:hypothetical protein